MRFVFIVTFTILLTACGGGGGGTSSSSNSSTTATDTTPSIFNFTDQNNVSQSASITSEAITVAGINAATNISITAGTYSIAGGAYTSSAGTVTNGQAVAIRHTSSGNCNTTVNTVLTIGGVSDTFTSTTAACSSDASAAQKKADEERQTLENQKYFGTATFGSGSFQ